MDQIEMILFGISVVYMLVTSVEVLSLKPKALIRKTPIVVKSGILILSFVNLVLLLSFALSQVLVPFIITNPGVVSVLALLGMTLLVGFGVSAAITSRSLTRRIAEFIRMTQAMPNPKLNR